MANLKLNSPKTNLEEIPNPDDVRVTKSEEVFIEEEAVPGRKLFQNKKANIGFMVAGAVMAIILVATLIWLYL